MIVALNQAFIFEPTALAELWPQVCSIWDQTSPWAVLSFRGFGMLVSHLLEFKKQGVKKKNNQIA